ncbi:hypothetical protein D9M71_613290 [compost metagenome]
MPVAGEELSFVIGAPQVVRLIGGMQEFWVNRYPLAQPSRCNQARLLEKGVDRRPRRALSRVTLFDQGLDLLRPHSHVRPTAQIQDVLTDHVRRRQRLPVAAPTLLVQALQPRLPVALHPLVAGLATDAEAFA